jgi:thiol-disulfide isomerase/thioredoxin
MSILNMYAQDPVPDFIVTATDSSTFQLYQHLDDNQVVVIELFFTYCPPCNGIATSVQEAYEFWGEGNESVEFISLSIMTNDLNEDVAEFEEIFSLTFPGAGADGGSIEAAEVYKSGQYGDYYGTPAFIVVRPDKEVEAFIGLGSGTDKIDAVNAAISSALQTVVLDIDYHVSGKIMPIQWSIEEPVVYMTASEFISNTSEIIQVYLDSEYEYTFTLPETEALDASITLPGIAFEDLSGVNVLDLVLIQQHILGLNPFENHLQILAADANGDGQLGALDIISLRKLILGIIDEIPGGSLRFEGQMLPDSTWVGSDVQLPFAPGLNEDIKIDWYPYKVGDVNTPVSPGISSSVEDRTKYVINVASVNTSFQADDEVTLIFESQGFDNITAFQQTIEFDSDVLHYEYFSGGNLTGLDENSFGLQEVENGMVTMVWSSPIPVNLTEGDTLFSLTFTTLQAGRLGDIVELSDAITQTQGYDSEGNIHSIVINWFESSEISPSSPASLLLSPNPASKYLDLDIDYDSDAIINFEIIDLSGKRVKSMEIDYDYPSSRTFRVNVSQLDPGLYTVRMLTEDDLLFVKTLMVIN